MSRDKIRPNIGFVTDEQYDKIDRKTGVLKESHRVVHMKNFEDFFIVCIAAWDDFNMFEGMQSKILRQCMKVCRVSTLHGLDGNTFLASEAIEEILRAFPDMKESAARQHLYRLCKMGCIKQTKKRGLYSLNPKYGVKGIISEETYGVLVVKAGTRSDYKEEDVVTIKHEG